MSSSPLDPPTQAGTGPAPLTLLTWGALVAGLIALCLGLTHAGTPGWDATGHAFAALRMAEALSALDLSLFWSEFSKPDFYAPLGRLGLASGFLLLGDGFWAPRAMNCCVWIVTIALSARLAARSLSFLSFLADSVPAIRR